MSRRGGHTIQVWLGIQTLVVSVTVVFLCEYS